MSKRIDNIVNELTNCIEEQIQTEVEMALGVRHREYVKPVKITRIFEGKAFQSPPSTSTPRLMKPMYKSLKSALQQ